jgi:putative phosphonate transport system ATP-binding protein
MNLVPLLEVRGLTHLYGQGCASCLELTGPAWETNICPRCGAVVALGDVSLELYPDEVLGIVGESGSGKSTLVRLLAFDLEAAAGEMYVRAPDDRTRSLLPPGVNLFSLSSFQKRQVRNALMGMVYQDPQLGLRLAVSSGGNIAERLLMAGWRNVQAMRRRGAELLEKTEIPLARMDEPPRSFSGGMRQRVQIAKALSNRPLFLFLDEVTTGLDLSVQARVLDLLRSLQQQFRLAMLVVSHDLGVIRLLTTRTVVMRYGRIVEAGLTDQILEDAQHPYTQLLVHSQL